MFLSYLIAIALAQLPHPNAPQLNDGAGVLNGHFQYWAEGVPLHWSVTRAREHYISKTSVPGGAALNAGPGYGYVQVTQRIDADGPLSGKTIAFSADTHASDPETVKLVLRLEDGTKFHSDRHPGNGKWTRLEVRARIPDDNAHDWVYVTLHHYNTPKHAAQFRGAQARIVTE